MEAILENEYLRLKVKDQGGSMTSIFDKIKNEECLYQPLTNSWQGQDIFIFPFIARLKDGYYLHNGKKYEFKNHGLIRYMTGDILSEEKRIIVSFKSNSETIERYPFNFEANIIYELIENEIKITYEIINKSNEKLPFELGAHPAFLVPGRLLNEYFELKGNTITIDKKRKLIQMELEETGSFIKGERIFDESNVIEVDRELFLKEKTLILKASDINEFELNKINGSKITVKKGDAPFVAIWSDKAWGNYICIEPWFGLPDYLDVNREITEKPYMNFVDVGSKFIYSYIIKVN